MTAPYYILEQLFRTIQLHPQKVAVALDDQMWTYSELVEQIKRTTYYLHRSNFVRGQIVYQFVERSLEMVSGLFGIICAGGVYCPLNPTDPYERITSILEQLRDEILSPLSDVEDIEELPDCEEQGDALIICTSGTTGRHKAVVHSFRSLSTSIRAFSQWDLHVYTSQDQVLQVAACSWILHISEIMLPLVVGGTLVLLRPNDHLDMDYFSQTLIQQQVTTITIGPGITQALTNYFEKTQRLATLQFVRNVIIGGEAMKPQQLVKLVGVLQSFDIKVCTQYGMTECNGALGGRLLSFDDGFVPMGYPLPGYRCLLIDKQGQTINSTNRSSKIAQLHIGGSALFNRYYNDPERTDNMFVTIDNQIYMKTGDLARYNERGELVHAGRIDFQVKVHGQRVETSEIENTIITWSPDKISNCLVTKAPQNDDFLVAYVVSNDSQIDTEELRQHCSKYLRQYMVPSIFIVLEKLPLNVNGKIDRKNLPIPDFSVLATVANDRRYIEPKGKVEILVHSLWSEILGHSRISTIANFFSIGGHSLLFIRIYQHYRTLFNCDKETINIRTFLDHNTIAEHAKLLENIKINNIQAKQWRALHISQCIASYAQERIYLDEKMRFPGKVAIYNELDVLQVTKGSLSADRLLQALRCILSKHKILRTSLVFNNDDSTLEQSITDKHLTFALAADQTFKGETDLHSIILQTSTNPNLFDLSSGRVFYCQILRQHTISDENNDKEIITNSDVLVIGFHHVAIDQSSVSIFLNDLCNTYNSNMTWIDDEESLQYIDYSVHERLIDTTPLREFWRSQLNGYNQECRLLLPVDRHFLYSDQRSGYASIAHISFDNEVSTSFLDCASSHQVTPFQLCLVTFYAFLFKLTYRQNDLCISCLNANRYRAELQNMIGMFISTLPYRIQVDSDWSFDELVEHVREKCVSILEHSHYPLQHILTDSQLKQSNVPFLETALNFITLSEKSQWFIDTATLEQLPMEQSYGAAKFDFALTSLYNPTSDDSKLSFCLTCSRDLFDETTAIIIAQRLKHLVNLLFSSKSISDEINPGLTSISKLNLILPAEAREIEDVIFCRQQNIVNDGESVSSVFSQGLMQFAAQSCHIWNSYGPAEATLGTTCHLIDVVSHMYDLPIGKPLPRYICLPLNSFLQSVVIQEEGELLVGGVGVFAGYLDRNDLTAKAVLEVDGELFYRTGDLVTIDNNGLLHYQGRKDHQIKLHGQRIELGEIERCLLNITSTSACVVMKWNDDYLVAYVQSCNVNEQELREHCQSHLPPHMIPSLFIILDKLPLNQNGKVDRKQLPSPDFSLSTLLSSDKSDTPLNQFEERIHTIWCEVLHCNENYISRTTSFFSVGGHSLLFIELYHHYQSAFNFDTHSLSIGPFLQQPTIRQHAQLLLTLPSNDTQTTRWHTLHINQDPSQDVINLCQRLYSTVPRLSFVVADATKHLLFENESTDTILCIQATHTFGEPIAITQIANEVVRILRPNGYLLWCDFCYINGSGTSVYDLIASDELIIEEKINVTKNVLHALDIQNLSRTDFIQRYIQSEEQEYFRRFAGLPGTQIYEDMRQGRSQYWRVVFRKKTKTDISVI
ncbi:unnamed protein product [Adineta steineri]|uniref:Carrier domain-containing protein n=1 Tax=Adineta steineri TaxID=433720 RepID=A0A813Z0X5_9BILA|nr:unnamed protein product [Adineta steineri]CAF1385032.1 unnamed protein product [Adineta steineri]